MLQAETSKIRNTVVYIAAIILVVGIAINLRHRAVQMLRPDFDEPVYMVVAENYANAIREGDFQYIIEDRTNLEHPQFYKLLYAALLSRFDPVFNIERRLSPQTEHPHILSDLDMQHFLTARYTSAVFGVLNVLLVSIVNPIAGFSLAIHTYTIKYTSQVYLEALPMFTLTIVVLAYIQSKRQWNKWLVISAVSLGITAASKYMYAVIGFAVVMDWVWTVMGDAKNTKGTKGWKEQLRQFKPLLAWGLLAILVFYMANPTLWTHPMGNLAESLFFHSRYAQSEHVVSSGLPWYQPFIWLFNSAEWHPIAIYTWADDITASLAVLGIWRMWKKHRVVVLWWALGMLFLLFWGTKWPQYILILVVPVTLCVPEGLRQIWAWLPDAFKSASYYGGDR